MTLSSLLVSAAYRDTLKPYTWWFPIVGRVPYKGYFDFAAARLAAKNLAADGYDVYVRPSDAFSTLGFFNDPLLNTTLKGDTLSLANTVIHELTHNTFYAAGQAPFNESFAMFVGARGAAAFFRSRGQEAAAAKLDAQWEDDKILARFWARVINSLDSAYKAHPESKEARITARDTRLCTRAHCARLRGGTRAQDNQSTVRRACAAGQRFAAGEESVRERSRRIRSGL